MIGVIALVLIVSVFILIMNRSRIASIGGGGKRSKGDTEAILKSANKRLAQNPNDMEALFAMATAYFDDENWDKAMRTYETMIDHMSTSSVHGVDPFEVHLRYGLSAQKLNLSEQAYKGFSVARTYRQDNFEVNYELGVLEFERKNYEKAVQLLQQARTQDPDNPAALRYLGHALFRLKKPKEAMNFIRKAIDLAPDDKESLYTLAECYHEANQIEQALRIFNHLRADPAMGPNSCLIA